MRKIVRLLIACIFSLAMVGCGSANDGKVNMPASSSDMEGANYQEVVKKLQDAGFTNVKTEALDDLVTGWLTKDGEVEQVTVDTYTVFSTDSRYMPDTEIKVSYHTFPEEQTQVTTEKETDENTVAEKETVEEPTQKIEETTLTIENCKELAALLALEEDYDPSITEFAKKYAGRTIEFDGNIAYMDFHENYETRYDFLIYVSNFSETTASGPSFKYKDVNVYDLHVKDSKIPGSISTGQNIHIVAKVIEYDEKSSLFYLDPVSTEYRE